MNLLAWGTVGAGVGAVAGLLPGLHVNTLCAITLAAVPSGPGPAVALAAAAAAHQATSLLPATYLGIPGEDSNLGVLPAHRMTLRGRGPDAVRLGLRSVVAGLLLSLLLLLPHKWILQEPGHVLAWMEGHMAWVLAAILFVLVAREAPRGVQHILTVLGVVALAGCLGIVSTRLPLQAILPVPTTALLPLLTGLFGAPALFDALSASRPIPEQEPARPGLRVHRAAVAGGLAAAGVTCMIPGLTSSAALAATQWAEDRNGKAFLCAQGALGAAHLVFSFSLLWVALRARTGLAVAVDALWSMPAWQAGPTPPAAGPILAACVLGLGLGALCTVACDRLAARWLPRLARGASLGGLLFLCGLVVALSGWMGLALFVVASLVGSLPPRLGVARMHLTACLLVPVLALHWELL